MKKKELKALAKKIADELGLELVLKPMAFDLILTALDTGKIECQHFLRNKILFILVC